MHPGIPLQRKLKHEHYQAFVPAADQIIAQAPGPFRLFVQLDDFHGWDLHGAWDDFKFGAAHYSDTERIAVVGEKKWEAWMTLMWKPFSRAEIRYFDVSERDGARTWIREGL